MQVRNRRDDEPFPPLGAVLEDIGCALAAFLGVALLLNLALGWWGGG